MLRTHDAGSLRKSHAGTTVTLAGWVSRRRDHGGVAFIDLRDASGSVQVVIRDEKMAGSLRAEWCLMITGEVLARPAGNENTNIPTGEIEIVVSELKLLNAAKLPPFTIEDETDGGDELRMQYRYLDLRRNTVRKNLELRHQVSRETRNYLDSQSFIEVETPMLQVMHGGATARPFKSFSNAYDMDLYLRIAPELFLKRCVVGGIERVFEINRNFRNEGADSSHSPEFAMIESYQAYGDWRSIADLTRELVQNAATAVAGSHVVTHHDGRQADLGGKWREISLYEAISEGVGQSVTALTPLAELKTIATKLGIKIDSKWITGKLAEEIFEHVAKDQLIAPTFVMGFPVDTSPLVRAHRDIPGVAEKWDLYIDGFELATGYSELIDPVIQRDRLIEQATLGSKGDLEAMQVDEDFLRAMEFGMPPMGGMGMGVDRLLMALTGLGIRETILFPLVKPEVE